MRKFRVVTTLSGYSVECFSNGEEKWLKWECFDIESEAIDYIKARKKVEEFKPKVVYEQSW
jgi:hypothetical protein